MIRSKHEVTISPYSAARLWLDAVINPLETLFPPKRRDRLWISMRIEAAAQAPATREFNMGFLQM